MNQVQVSNSISYKQNAYLALTISSLGYFKYWRSGSEFFSATTSVSKALIQQSNRKEVDMPKKNWIKLQFVV